MQLNPSRHRRHALSGNTNRIVESNKKFYPPKPPKELPMPTPRRRPPPPPPLQEEMFQNQHETVQPKTENQPRYSGVSKAPSKQVDTNSANYNKKASPATTSTTTTLKPVTQSVKTTSKPVIKAEKGKTKPKPPVKPNRGTKSRPKPYVKSESVNHEQNAANTLEAGESPKEALNVEAALELQALIGSANLGSEHGHEHAPHEHSHGHAHTHSHPEPMTPKPAKTNNGPPAEMQAKFSSMFNAWYNAKFGDAQPPTTVATTSKPKYITAKSKQTKQPSKVYTPKKKPGPVTKSVDKNALFEEFMTMFQSQLNVGEVANPVPKYPAKVTSKPVKTKAATMTPTTATTTAPQTKTNAPEPKAKVSIAKSPSVKFGPRKKKDYLKPTTPVYPEVKTTAATGNDPTQVKLVTLSHPESLAYPPNESTNTGSGSNASMTEPSGGSTPPAPNTGVTDVNLEILTRSNSPTKGKVVTRKQTYMTTTMRPTPDPDLLADINEARVMQGLPEVQAHQVDLQGNLLPFYQRQMRIGRLPARPHPLHNPGGYHHQLQHQHNLPHFHPEQGLGAGYNSFPNMFYPQPTNNGAAMAYEPFPRPNIPGPTTPAPKTRAAEPVPNTVNMAPMAMVEASPLNPLAYLYFFNALNTLLQPQNNRGYLSQLYGNRNGQGYNVLFNQNSQNNGMHGSNAYNQLEHSHASGQSHASEHTHASAGSQSSNSNGIIHGDLGHNQMDLHHQAIHREAGNSMTPNLHRQVHRLLRNRELIRQRGNMFGMGMQNFPAATQAPFIDPDLYADMMEARAAALAG